MQRKIDELAVAHGGYYGRLYRRSGSEKHWLKAKLPDGGWYRQSTGTDDLSAAQARAVEMLVELKVRAKYNVAPQARKFAKVAEATLAELEQEGRKSDVLTTPESYRYVVNAYLIPFLGDYNIENIDRTVLARFDEWRKTKLGRNPKRSTVQTHNAALLRVFKTALRKGWLKDWQVPSLENSGEEGETRATFTQEEFERLSDYLGRWVQQGREGLSRQIKLVLREMVLVVAQTGMRPGTETRGLDWSDVEEDYKHADGETYLRLWLNGKTGKREIIAPSDVRQSLERLRQLNPHVRPDQPVFSTLDGRYPELCRPFQRLLKEAGLLQDRHGDLRTLYSLRHFYATRQRERGVSFEVLATQMGTSIAMLERHYVHVTPTADARILAGLPDPKFALVHDFVVSETERKAREELTLAQEPGRRLVVGPSGSIRTA